MKAHLLKQLIATAALAVSTSLWAADAPAKPADKAPAKPTAPAAGDVKKDIEKFNAQRDSMLSQRQALISQLKNATAEQQKAILEKMKELGDAQRELNKQIRDDMRKLKQGQGAPGRG